MSETPDFNSPGSFVSKTINTYATSLLPNKVFVNLQSQIQQIDNLTGVTTNQYVDIYDAYNNPKKTRIVANGGEKINLIDYEDNPTGTGSQYYIGRPVKKPKHRLWEQMFSLKKCFLPIPTDLLHKPEKRK